MSIFIVVNCIFCIYQLVYSPNKPNWFDHLKHFFSQLCYLFNVITFRKREDNLNAFPLSEYQMTGPNV